MRYQSAKDNNAWIYNENEETYNAKKEEAQRGGSWRMYREI